MGNETARYLHGHHESVLRSHRWRTATNSAAYLLGELRPHMRVLDVGCGPGTITVDLAERVPQGEVTGIDNEPAIVEQARDLAGRRGLTNVRFATADVYTLDHPDDTFCVVHAHQVLQHLGDPVRALREMRRVCRPGGVVAVRDADFGGMLWYPNVPAMDDWRELYSRVARGSGGEPDAGRRLHDWARQAGFTDITSSSSTWCYASPEDRSWWAGLWADRTVASSYARTAVEGGYATVEELRQIAAGWREWGAHQDGWFSVLCGEVLCRVP
ncbi:ubiquinone biosynthesis methyltransferase UbiE [Wenjunlia vitaminophila]|uniref:Ubiquinone biosynthesis methyltransferase UbiE n=1 Tax=Wenjunlia vitaminophila TaxID=76728 RepID=A0A0T6LSL8_WENVI|nr:methyltransferase domain-containing protein [Wenjunlia vitaminophila]KRV49000.1 ubiquinone biosynthesis methyltransferase UbiE [Wenjunlia vitaminophila]